MYRVILLTFMLSLVAVSATWADVPLPPNLKYVDPRVRFDGMDKYADHVFFLRFQTGNGNPFAAPARVVELKNKGPFPLKAGRRIANMVVLAMTRKDFDKRKTDDPAFAWLTKDSTDVQKAMIEAPSTTASAKDKQVPVTEYRVDMKEGKLTVELLKKDKPRSEASPDGRLPQVAFGIFSALSLALFGVWFVRRRSP